MITARRDTIKDLITNNGAVTFEELTALFPDISSMTLRRDIEFLREKGIAEKVRGGARVTHGNGAAREDVYSIRATEDVDDKKVIARKALTFIRPGRSIFMDSGTTMMCLAELIPDEDLSILASGPNISMEILKNVNPKVTIIGGQISRNNLSVSGSNSINFIKNINIDIAYIATSGFSFKAGFTSGDYNECELKRAIIKKAGKSVMLMTTGKIDRNLPYTFAVLKDIDVLISDGKLPANIAEKIKKAGVQVL